MHRTPHSTTAARVAVVAIVALVGPAASAFANDYKPGEVIEYRVRGSVPEMWERGIIIRPLEGGKQWLIHEKPSQFFPEGPEIARSPADIRRPVVAPNKPVIPVDPSVVPPKPVDPKAPLIDISKRPIVIGKRTLLSADDVFVFARDQLGPGDPFAHPQREAILDRIRDHIKTRGTTFLPDLNFSNRMGTIGANSVHISYAIEANYGPPPKLDDYFGAFLLRTTNRGSKSNTKVGGRPVVRTEDSQHESGLLTIDKGGTYTWAISRSDPPAKWIVGKWREAKPEEMHLWEGGPAIWLEKARAGQDYMVRGSRVPDYEGWIDVGVGKGRTPVEYGRRPE